MPASSDTEFLKSYTANRTTSTTNSDSPKVQDATKDLQQATKEISEPKQARRNEGLRARAKRLQDSEVPVEEEEKEETTTNQPILPRVTRGLSVAGESIQPAVDKVQSLRTPGGIGLLLLILALLIFTVVRVNAQGDTRLKQLWYMLNGRATIQGRQTIQGSTTVVTNATEIPASTTTPENVSQDLAYHGVANLGF